MDDFGPDLSEAISAFSRRLGLQRARQIEERVNLLMAAGIPFERLTLGENPKCPECYGVGVVLKCESFELDGHCCTQCLGVSIVIDRRTPA